MSLTLVIMAAGMGSRFGGIKQIEPVYKNGEIIMDYSIYDAKRAGFTKVVFVIKKEMEETFKQLVIKNVEKIIDCTYVFQEIGNLPNGLIPFENREKPWGTAHAVLAAKNEVKGAFAAINADDFYGFEAFKLLADFLKDKNTKGEYCMVGYKLKNTLSEKGFVSRGVCVTDENSNLISVTEKTNIEKKDNVIVSIEQSENKKEEILATETIVSMNCWGFTKEFFGEIENQFSDFMEKSKDNKLKAEFYLPSVVSKLLEDKKATVKVINCNELWYGFTYKEDKEIVEKAIANFIESGKYPEKLYV